MLGENASLGYHFLNINMADSSQTPLKVFIETIPLSKDFGSERRLIFTFTVTQSSLGLIIWKSRG